MDVRDRVVVVTGGASGIGRSLAQAFVAHGAAGVVVADRDAAGAVAVAEGLRASGGKALAVTTDVSKEQDVQRLVAEAEEAYGPIDLFCANAGIIVTGGVEATDEAWDRIWAVNVKSHIYAARAVLPGMLARGEGYLLHTASAAGLLTQLGSAPYSVTKHAVVALAEWLSITHGDAGIKVSCLCPQAVQTGMTGGGRGAEPRPATPPGTKGTAMGDGLLQPEDVAEVVIAALAEERFLILPHPEVETYERRRSGDRERWLRGMRRAQAALSGRGPSDA
ncbi:MAG: Oxidoreductase, short-chain dehydrogenase/reductase family [uncultured Acidimicrobiales bacterium]|uniref:Oxidoreductase, short-chain dehydrogenase/reductase family n=1 Tax=uncultured Acidimicrobiales bacterium TaxID=310071 RepID=A0A6J4H6U7_9ACTN|nr:MAG: Oxidoreductase, short-chain dehydrogenase/reductase family [uncultured Acidimicrobiales bacterium]